MNTLLLALGVILIPLGAVCLIVSPIAGIFGIACGIFVIYASAKNEKKKIAEKAQPVPQPMPQKPIGPQVVASFYFPIDNPDEVLKALGTYNIDYSLTKGELISEYRTDERIYQYEKIKGRKIPNCI